MNFLKNKPVVYMLFGPTGCGKSELISKISKKRKIALISADSVQVYKGLDIGSAKPNKNELSNYPHYLIDIKSPFEKFDVSQFISLADDAIKDCLGKGFVPIISGGTAFYFKNFIYGLSAAPQSNPKIRAQVADEHSKFGDDAMFEKLKQVDEISANRINPNDTYRVLRALEVYYTCGKPLSSFALPSKPRDDYKFVIIGIKRSKEELANRIQSRLNKMIDAGLENEILQLKSLGLNPTDHQSMRSIGYAEWFLQKNRDEIINQIYINTLHYAKRQMTFFRSLKNVKWLDLTTGQNRPFNTLAIKV